MTAACSGTLTSHPPATLGKQPWEERDRVWPRGDHREGMKPWCPLEQSQGRVAPALVWMGCMAAPAEEPLGTPRDPWGRGLCLHTEEQVQNSGRNQWRGWVWGLHQGVDFGGRRVYSTRTSHGLCGEAKGANEGVFSCLTKRS